MTPRFFAGKQKKNKKQKKKNKKQKQKTKQKKPQKQTNKQTEETLWIVEAVFCYETLSFVIDVQVNFS